MSRAQISGLTQDVRRAVMGLDKRINEVEERSFVKIIGSDCPPFPPTNNGEPYIPGDAYLCPDTGHLWVWVDPPGEFQDGGLFWTALHEDLTDVTPDQHHPQFHNLDSHTDVVSTSPASGDFLVWNGSAWVPALNGRMNWAGTWDASTYLLDDVVIDDGWTMICATEGGCTEKPAPSPTGDPFYLYDGVDPITSATEVQLFFGNRYEFQQGGYITGYRVWTVAGNNYTVYSVVDPTGSNEIQELLSFTGNGGWEEFGISPILVGLDTVFDLIAIVSEPDPTPTVWYGEWNYTKPQNPAAPASGQVIHANSLPSSFRVNKTDNNLGDRGAELLNMLVGDQIQGPNIRWSIQAVTDVGSYVDFTVAPTTQDSPIGVFNFGFETVTATPITYLEDLGYWPTTPFNVQGIYGTSQAGLVLSDNAYGTDLLVQNASVSDEWEVVSAPGGSGGGGGGDATQYLNQLLDVDSPNPSAQQVLTFNDLTGVWEPRAPLASLNLAAFGYTFKTDVGPLPGTGQIQLNNADPSLATEMYVNEVDGNGADISLFLEYLTVGSWCNLGDRDDYQARHTSWDVTAATVENGTVWTVPLELFETVGGGFSNNEKVNLVLRFVSASEDVYLDDLVDVDAPTPALNESLVWNGTKWVPFLVLGTPGEDGAPGSVWYTSNGPPDPGGGVDNDQTLDVDSGDVYTKITGTWVLSGNIKGPAGDNGPQGPQGPVGGTNFSSQWNYGSTEAPPPATGFIEANHIDTLWVSTTDLNGQNVTTALDSVEPGDSVWIRDTQGATEQMLVTAKNNPFGTYFNYTVTYVAGGGTVDQDEVVFFDVILKADTLVLPGGTTGQATRKLSDADGDADWADDPPHVLEGTEAEPPAGLEFSQLFYDADNEVINPELFWYGTQAQYDALPSKSPLTLYVIVSA